MSDQQVGLTREQVEDYTLGVPQKYAVVAGTTRRKLARQLLAMMWRLFTAPFRYEPQHMKGQPLPRKVKEGRR